MEAATRLPPVQTIEQFANESGVSEDTVRGWVRKGCIPTVKIGKRRMINIISLVKQVQQEEE